MSIPPLKLLVPITLLASSGVNFADPQLNSWYSEKSGQYARIYESTTDEANGNSVTTWSRGAGVQNNPTYPGVHEVSSDANWVYIRTTGLGSHVMGPWYLDAAKTIDFVNFPSNTATTYRFPRVPQAATSTELTGAGPVGFLVDGVAMFDSRDTFSYDNSAGADQQPNNNNVGDGIWNRDAYTNEAVTFDSANAHQAQNQYHYHANPPALRYLLGGHVDYNSATNVYTEKAGIPTKHSPIIGWVRDGYPIYGPYGYSDPNDASSAISLMRTGYRKRMMTQRHSLPAWAARIQKGTTGTAEFALAANEYGPDVSATYTIGHYIEDYEYLGDVGQTVGVDFDLDEHNGRWCVTPEFPLGTYCYFTAIESDGTPVYPYNIGRSYYGSPTGGEAAIPNNATITFEGGPEIQEEINGVSVDGTSGDVTLTWSAVEGGTYTVQADDDLVPSWTELSTTTSPILNIGTFTESGAALSNDKRFYRVKRTALATFDATGFVIGDSTTETITIDMSGISAPPLPPSNATPASMTIGGIAGTSLSYDGSSASGSFDLSSLTSGTHAVVIVFSPGPTYNLTYDKP